jgi:signal transduction histidine kinase
MRQIHLRTTLLFYTFLLASIACAVDSTSLQLKLSERSIPELKLRLSEIDTKLKQLASYSLRGGTGSLGYSSRKYRKSENNESIQIDLDGSFTIDQVILIPTLWRDSKTGVRSEGFPLEFKLIVGTAESQTVVASFTEKDQLLPRIAPMAISFAPIQASWCKIEVTKLSPDIGGTTYSLQLSEIMIFSGLENVALQKRVTGSHRWSGNKPWKKQFITDGFSPFFMDAATGELSQTQLIRVLNNSSTDPALTLDLGASYTINQINLHTANVALSIPMIQFNSWAVPRHLRITGANNPDFSDGKLLFEHKQTSIYDTGPILMQRFPETRCRYLQITILDHKPVISTNADSPNIAFTEIEVLEGGKNVAQHAQITASPNLACSPLTLYRMTDGLNYYGDILPIRNWMNQLAERHELEKERPLVLAALNQAYERQKKNLNRLAWALALLTTITIVSLLINKVLRQRAIFQTRERIAANLHDELGANLHAIGLFADMAKQEIAQAAAPGKWTNLNRYVSELHELTIHAGKTARYTTNMLEAKELYENLPEEMQRTASHLLTDLEHEFHFENVKILQRLSARKRIDLFLFFKECLTNTLRHSGATRVEITLTANSNSICLCVRDNGLGLSEMASPPSLKRRARLLKAKLNIHSPSEGGTEVILKFNPQSKWQLTRQNK